MIEHSFILLQFKGLFQICSIFVSLVEKKRLNGEGGIEEEKHLNCWIYKRRMCRLSRTVS